MKQGMLLLLVVLASGCGKLGYVSHEGKIKTVISIDNAQLEEYFTAYCKKKLTLLALQAGATDPTPSEADMEVCVNEEIGGFLAALSALNAPKVPTTP